MARGRCRSMEVVGLSRRVGLVVVGEPRFRLGPRLILEEPESPAPFREPDEFTRKERRSRRDPGGFPLGPVSPGSLLLTAGDPVSGRELVRNRGRWTFPFSSFWSEDVERYAPKRTLLSRRELVVGDGGAPLPLGSEEFCS